MQLINKLGLTIVWSLITTIVLGVPTGTEVDMAQREAAYREYNAYQAFMQVAQKYSYDDVKTSEALSYFQHDLFERKRAFVKEFFTAEVLDEETIKEWSDNQREYFESKALSINHMYPALPSISGGYIGACTGCDNVDFEQGLTSGEIDCWDYDLGQMLGGTSGATNFSSTNYASAGGRIFLTTPGTDPLTNNLLSTVAPGSNYSVRLEDQTFGANAAKLSRTFTVDPSSPWYKYKYAVVLEEPSNPHPETEKPFFQVKMYVGGNEITCAAYKVISEPNNPDFDFVKTRSTGDLNFKNWTEVVVPLDDYVGQNVTVEFIAADCAWGGHIGYAYLDGDCLNGSIVSSGCVNNERSLTAPSGFFSYYWKGPELDDNAGQTITASKSGTYDVKMITVTGCTAERSISVSPDCPGSTSTPCSLQFVSITPSTCNNANNSFDLSVTISYTNLPPGAVIVLTSDQFKHAEWITGSASQTFEIKNIWADNQSHTITARIFGGGFIGLNSYSCTLSDTYTAPSCSYNIDTIACTSCLGSFRPIKGEKYIVSAWVKEQNITGNHVTNYSDSKISVVMGATTNDFVPEGQIIDGWQRIFGEFEVPASGANTISIKLVAQNTDVFFDDVRVHPKNGSMISYVYDPISLKLVATLDENNYATFYEYDKEGSLIRVKKETERGIYTIKENRQSIIKN